MSRVGNRIVETGEFSSAIFHSIRAGLRSGIIRLCLNALLWFISNKSFSTTS